MAVFTLQTRLDGFGQIILLRLFSSSCIKTGERRIIGLNELNRLVRPTDIARTCQIDSYLTVNIKAIMGKLE